MRGQARCRRSQTREAVALSGELIDGLQPSYGSGSHSLGDGVVDPGVWQKGISLFSEFGLELACEARWIESSFTFQPIGFDARIDQDRAGTPNQQIGIVLGSV